MRLKFKDFYGQYVTVHDETGSGNVRIEVNTMPSLNDVGNRLENECTVNTDISLDGRLLS